MTGCDKQDHLPAENSYLKYSTVKSVLKIRCIDTFTFKSISNIFELHLAWVSIPETFQSFPATFSHFSCFQDI